MSAYHLSLQMAVTHWVVMHLGTAENLQCHIAEDIMQPLADENNQ